MNSLLKKNAWILISFALLTSCLEKPKEKQEQVTVADEYEKALDSIIGQGSITPSAIKVGDKDTRIETINVSNSLIRELFRRELTVISVKCEPQLEDGSCPENPAQREFKYNVRIIERDNQGNAQESTVTRTTVLAVTPDGYYQFFDDGNDKTIHSWDYIVGLRGFCHSFQTDKYIVNVTCSNMSVTSGTWGNSQIAAIPVRTISLIRHLVVTDKSTGQTQSSKLRYTVQIGIGVPEISKVVSYCSEGLQQFENQIYYLARCNNLESL